MEIKEYKLGDICIFKTGIDPLNYEKNGTFPFIKLGNTTNNQINYDSEEKINTNRKEKAIRGDLLLCWSCSIGESFIVEKPCFYSTAFYKLVQIKNVYINRYLHYFFVKNKLEISKLGVGTVLKKANMKILGNYSIKLPNIQTQQAIINIIEPFENLNIFYLNKIRLLNNLKHRLGKKLFFSLEFNKFCFIKNCKGKIQQSKEGTYRYYNCSSNVSFIENYNEYSNNDDLLIITTRGTITSHIIPRNTYFYATNNLMIFKGEGIHCFDYWFKNNKKSIISGTSIPMITKKDLNFLNFAYDKNIEELLQKINNLIFFFEKIKNIISIIIKKLIEIYIE